VSCSEECLVNVDRHIQYDGYVFVDQREVTTSVRHAGIPPEED